MIVVAVALMYVLAGGCGIAVAMLAINSIEVPSDGPEPRAFHPAWLILAMLALSVALMMRHASLVQLGTIAAVSVPLIAAWYADARTGLIPDWFTLVPLGAMLIYVVFAHAWLTGLSAIVIFVPFALTAFVSKGVGMGWGDVKLATFSAAVLGMMPALPTFAVACLAATAVSAIRDRGRKPIAFGPYLAGSTLLALAIIG